MKEKVPLDINHFLPELRTLGLFIQDVEGRKAYPNDLWKEMGYTEEEMLNMGFMNFIHPDDREIAQQSVDDLMNREGHMSRFMFRMKSTKGEWRWILSTSVGVEYNEKGEVSKYFGYDNDVTDEIETRRKLEKALQEAELLRSTAEIISSHLDQTQIVDAVLKQAEAVFSFTTASVQILKNDSLEIVGSIGHLKGKSPAGSLIPLDMHTPCSLVIKNRTGMIVEEQLSALYPDLNHFTGGEIESWMGVPLLYKGNVTGLISFCHTSPCQFHTEDLGTARSFAGQVAIALENSRLYEEAREISIKDALTGCYSRRHFFSSFEDEYKIARRYGHELSLILFDLDHFKKINDDFGHLHGDEALKEVVRITSCHLRDSDILCRYGGEEFAIILPSTGIDDAFAVAERIRTSIKTEFSLSAVTRTVSVSLGCSSLKPEKKDDLIKDLIHRADMAMYESKRAGRDRTTVLK